MSRAIAAATVDRPSPGRHPVISIRAGPLYALEAASCSLRLRSDWQAEIESSKPCAEATGANVIGCVRAITSAESGLVRESMGRESRGRVSMGRESTSLESVKTNPVLRRSIAWKYLLIVDNPGWSFGGLLDADRLTGIDQVRVFDLWICCSDSADVCPDVIFLERTVNSHRYLAERIARSHHHSGLWPRYGGRRCHCGARSRRRNICGRRELHGYDIWHGARFGLALVWSRPN